MEIKYASLKDQKQWDNFVSQSASGSFLQSWFWGEFQASLGNKIYRIKITDKGKFIAAALMVKQKLPKNYCWLYSPRGPILGPQNWDLKIGQGLFQKIEKIVKKERAVFLKLEPQIEKKLKLKVPKKFLAAKSVQPENTQILNLKPSVEELLDKMHAKTRYNIRLAEKKAVQTRISKNTPEDIAKFFQIMEETAKRNRIKIFSQNHYQKLLDIFAKHGSAELFLAEYQNEVVAGIIVLYFGDYAYYLHGGSLYEYRNLMAPFLLQWRAILKAKKQGKKFYDFWGVAPSNEPRHKWAGITRFKKGFGGEEINFMGAYDLVYQPLLYKAYKMASAIKRSM